jgi:hypothetical protein
MVRAAFWRGQPFFFRLRHFSRSSVPRVLRSKDYALQRPSRAHNISWTILPMFRFASQPTMPVLPARHRIDFGHAEPFLFARGRLVRQAPGAGIGPVTNDAIAWEGQRERRTVCSVGCKRTLANGNVVLSYGQEDTAPARVVVIYLGDGAHSAGLWPNADERSSQPSSFLIEQESFIGCWMLNANWFILRTKPQLQEANKSESHRPPGSRE